MYQHSCLRCHLQPATATKVVWKLLCCLTITIRWVNAKLTEDQCLEPSCTLIMMANVFHRGLLADLLSFAWRKGCVHVFRTWTYHAWSFAPVLCAVDRWQMSLLLPWWWQSVEAQPRSGKVPLKGQGSSYVNGARGTSGAMLRQWKSKLPHSPNW